MNNFILTSAFIAALTLSGDLKSNNIDSERSIEIKNSADLEYGNNEKIESNTASVHLKIENLTSFINDIYIFNKQVYPILKNENFSEEGILSKKFDKIEAAIIDIEDELKVKESSFGSSSLGEVLENISGKLIYGAKPQ